jgi:DNA helicase-2/ATP-dependent DNA helicase PcrA
MTILKSLNPPQQEAAKHLNGPLLIIAGAGSGKTRVLTHRIAYMIKEHHVSPHNIIAVTFTNKAAREMKYRIRRLVGILARDMWIGTFHSICGRILRHDIDKIGWTKNFCIYDEYEQLTIMKETIKELNFDEKHFRPQTVLDAVSSAKNQLIGPEEYANAASDFREERVALAYKVYQEKLAENNALDFDDMLMYTVRLLSNNPKVLEYYQERFQYINVDEYQDTNHAQYVITKLLAGKNKNICVVGDEDQSIYAWRGADFRNILNFEKDYPRTKVIKLEQNYRSTKNILFVANSVIANNSMRKDKALWTKNDDGDEIVNLLTKDEHDEAHFLVEEIKKLTEDSLSCNDIVILYRTNAQSRIIEETLLKEGLPYRMLSGVRFYERKEIKDVLAYLRVIHNTRDNLSLARTLTNTAGGIGKGTVSKLEKHAASTGKSLFDVAVSPEGLKIQNKTKGMLKEFSSMIIRFQNYANEMTISKLLDRVLAETRYLKNLEAEGTEEALSRAENLKELIGVAKEFEDGGDDPYLGAFLTQISLVTDQDRQDESKSALTLMTLHGAKGLEFPVVFMTGMEEGIFPHYRSYFDPAGLEEERRLCYVGITRAKEKLYLVNAEQRTLFGESWYNGPSRFLSEMPAESVKQKKSTRLKFAEDMEIDSDEIDVENLYSVGDNITHPKWGGGEITAVDGDGGEAILTINFNSVGEKNLILKYAKLKSANA